MNDSDIDVTSSYDPWDLDRGTYKLGIGLFYVESDKKLTPIIRAGADVEVNSRKQARYLHNLTVDLKRKINKLNKSYRYRLF